MRSEEIFMPSEEMLKELFALFTSATRFEREQIYDRGSGHYYLDEQLLDEYSLTEEKREYAIDAWRATIYFLYRHGYKVEKDGYTADLSMIEDLFIT